MTNISNPKRAASQAEGQAKFYAYYAGYTTDFAESMLESMSLPSDAVVLDPWNGAGTTTAACAQLGMRAIGSDLNPAMAVIAKGRLLSARSEASIVPLAKRLVNAARELNIDMGDPLCAWFTQTTAKEIRVIEKSLSEGLLEQMGDIKPQISQWSDLACFFYIGLFNTVKRLLKPLRTSNPTWLKRPALENQKICLSKNEVRSEFLAQIEQLRDSLRQSVIKAPFQLSLIEIKTQSSTNLEIEDASVNAVLTSPPYCTRIDYGVATSAELAILNPHLTESFDSIRRKLMGTATVGAGASESLEWGNTCLEFLEKIFRHDSKASSTYYYKSHCEYFDSLFKSIKEIGRVLGSGGRAAIVVQNSYYKDILNDLPKICIEMGEMADLSLVDNHRFTVGNSLAKQNPRARRYLVARQEVEEVVILEKQ